MGRLQSSDDRIHFGPEHGRLAPQQQHFAKGQTRPHNGVTIASTSLASTILSITFDCLLQLVTNRLLTIYLRSFHRSIGPAREHCEMPNALAAEEKLWWMIVMLRASLSVDWAKLALEPLTYAERIVIMQRLTASNRALNDLKNIEQQKRAI